MTLITAKILSQRSHRIPGKLQVTEYFFRVPLDHAQSNGPSLRLFARGVTKAETQTSTRPSTPPPWLTYLQGGPGFGCRPPSAGGWISAALDAGYRVLLLDHRGTGLSQPVTPAVLAAVGREAEKSSSAAEGSGPSVSIAAQAAYLKHFRSTSIVEDAEAVRLALAEAEGADPGRKWSVIGQSFGGFCVMHYLTRFPEGLKEAFTCGGLPPLSAHPDEVYSRLIKRWIARTHEYYAKFPEDVARVHEIAQYLREHNVRSAAGGQLTVNRLRGLGMDLGFHGGFERMHNLILRLHADLQFDGELSGPTIEDFDNAGGGFDNAIIYAILHEPCYLQGFAANWSAERIINATAEYQTTDPNKPFFFTAEAITRSAFEDYPSLVPLQELAEHLAQSSDWPMLYDEEKLAKNAVPLYAATYLNDQYVDFDLAQQTAAFVPNCKVWITNAAYHDAIRAKADEVIRMLIGLKDDRWD